ncbi:arabinoxylan arabinofuranohydrolase [Paenibacillus sp. FSL R7-0273]|uniref:glycoside hydrolase family 43 protein n=1 Tax=Paenibacillus sp. FSL R7-0273 TaxID=1536772 RepID=UPI0004F87B44|nr:glycoside hydrolase family 43 protein [Paenibacillus sp. FSL R7-0273]AIQ47403.1 arabinoxylan arabinofuranohydrolase [Paenibacillus sp. FSL R7-0273]OMF96043.1 arabinoxylan arabinofuranohydrolase [Paenibacillus sp. FSL R7-0273]
MENLLKQATGKLPPAGNPLVAHRYGADPYALVFGDRVYLYMTNDALEYDENGVIKENTYSSINKIAVISSADLVNWTDHGEIAVAGPNGAAKWATQSWAPAAAHKVIGGKDTFFLYFANNASGIGVLSSDSPVGPWIDPIGEALILRSTPGVEEVTWLFDPAVLVDDDGNGYIYFGGGVPEGEYAEPGTARMMRLGDDMISVTGTAEVIAAPFMFEDAGIHKRDGLYYFTYCSNFYDGERPEGSPPAGEIAYMTGSTPMGPWTYQGTMLRNPGHFFGVSGNNHHAIFQFHGEWYIAYHAQTLSKAQGIANGYRSTHLNRLFHEKDGSIPHVEADYSGVQQISRFNPYQNVQAVTLGWSAGIKTERKPGSQDQIVTDIHNGDWIGLSGVEFGDVPAAAFLATVICLGGGSIKLHLDHPAGPLIGVLTVPASNESELQSQWRTEVSGAEGVHDLYLVFTGPEEAKLFELVSWQFSNRIHTS